METDQPKDFQTCSHCGARLRLNAGSSLCRKCRFQGHKEFGACDKCKQANENELRITNYELQITN